MFQKKYSLQKDLSSKIVLRLMEFMFYNLTKSFALTEIANRTGTSKSNVYPALKRLGNLGLLRAENYHGRKVYGINTKADLAFPVWNLLMVERFMNLDENLRYVLNRLLENISREKVTSVILYGNAIYDTQHRDEIGLCIVCEDKRERRRMENLCRRFRPGHGLGPYFMAEREFENLRNPVVLDSLINGIPLFGRERAFGLRVGIKALPREYLRYRLDAARKALNDADSQEKEYLKDLAIAVLQEVEDELPSGRRESTRRISPTAKWIDELEENIKEN